MARSTDPGGGTSRAVDRALSLLDLLSRSSGPLGTREMARELGFPLSATHRLIATMERHGFVRQDSASGKYSLGAKVLELGTRFLEKLEVRSAALPVMQEMRDACDETISLFVADGYYRLCIESMESRQSVRQVVGVGTRLPLYTGASGKLLLAYLPEERREAVLQGSLERFTEHTITDVNELRQEVEAIRTEGFARSTGERVVDSVSVAAPIWVGGQVVAAITISVPIMRYGPEREEVLRTLVVRGAAEVTGRLGARSRPSGISSG